MIVLNYGGLEVLDSSFQFTGWPWLVLGRLVDNPTTEQVGIPIYKVIRKQGVSNLQDNIEGLVSFNVPANLYDLLLTCRFSNFLMNPADQISPAKLHLLIPCGVQ